MEANVAKIVKSSLNKEPVVTQVEASSSRKLKMYKAASFWSQSSVPDVDKLEIGWSLCFICQLVRQFELNFFFLRIETQVLPLEREGEGTNSCFFLIFHD